MLLTIRFAEEAGIEPAAAVFAANGFEDRGDHQIPSASAHDDKFAGAFCQPDSRLSRHWSDHGKAARGDLSDSEE